MQAYKHLRAVPGLPNIKRHHLALGALVLVVVVVILLNLPGGQQPTRAAGAWATVSAGARITCALDREGSVACWGASHGTPPAGLRLRRLSVGGNHACGITSAGALTCWGRAFKGSTRPPAGQFVELSAGWDYTCAVRQGGKVACWGWNLDGQASAPEGTFSSLAAGYHHTCGVRTDGEVVCWGVNRAGQCDAPAGPFEQVVVSQCHTCGLRASGKVQCWGCDQASMARPGGKADNAASRNTPPSVQFKTLSAGFLHTCGVTTADTARCWGHNAVGQSAPPPGAFTQVEAGFFHTCGLTVENVRLECWGWREPVLSVPGQQATLNRAQARPVAPGAPVPGLTDHTCPYEGMGLLYLRQGRASEASQSLGRATKIVSNVKYRKFMTMAQRHIEQGRRAAAERMMRKAHAAIQPPGAEPGAAADPSAPAPTSMPPRCKGNADCPGEQICNVDGCLPRCSASSPNCPAGFLCDVYLRHCRVHPAHCTRGAQCTRVTVCHPGHKRCYARCSERAPCSAGMVCDDKIGACAPRGAPCTLQSHCKGAGERCFVQGCLALCSDKDPSCPVGRRCNQEQEVCE